MNISNLLKKTFKIFFLLFVIFGSYLTFKSNLGGFAIIPGFQKDSVISSNLFQPSKEIIKVAEAYCEPGACNNNQSAACAVGRSSNVTRSGDNMDWRCYSYNEVECPGYASCSKYDPIVNGVCNNSVENGCTSGSFSDTTDDATNYLWSCYCTGYGCSTSGSCSKAKPLVSCNLPWGGSITSGSSVTAYAVQSSACGTYGSASETRTCTNGSLSGSYTSQTSFTQSSRTGQATSAVACGSACANETQYCQSSGAWSGSGTTSCSPSSRTMYAAQTSACGTYGSASEGQSCQSNGSWSGSYSLGSAPSASSRTMYAAQTSACGTYGSASEGQSCQSNGSWSGSYSLGSAPSASSRTGYLASSVSCGSSCSTQTQYCQSGGGWGGTGIGSCSVTQLNGSCGGSTNSCVSGSFSDTADTSTYNWDCLGACSGSSASCSSCIPQSPSCGGSWDSCAAGSWSDATDSGGYARWNCTGSCGGGTTACSISQTNGSCSALYNSCASGTFSDTVDSGGYARWSCNGTNGGTNATNCSIAQVTGSCGGSWDSCSTGSWSDGVDDATYYKWNCNGLYGGGGASCQYNKPITGVCNNTVIDGCSAGTLTQTPADDASYNYWTCYGQYTGANSGTCSYAKINGVCGGSNNSCTSGSLSDTADDATYYKWNCLGQYNGTTANCTVPKPPLSPVISGPTSGAISTGYTFNIQGTDNAGYQVKYGLDWDNDGTIDGYSSLGASDWIYPWLNNWGGAGAKYFKALTEASDGRQSSWSSTYTMTIYAAPVLTLSSTLSTIDYNTSTAVSWTSTDSTSCSLTKAGSGFSTLLSGTGISTGVLTSDTIFALSCTGPGGTTNQSVTVKVRPQVTVTATPTNVSYGAASSVSWSSLNAASCIGMSTTGTSNAGASTGALIASSAFGVTCTSSGGATQTATATVTVSPLNGLCNTTHYSCSKGNSVNNISGAIKWTWSCNGANGGSNDSCGEDKPAPNTPTISGPVTGKINTNYNFDFQASNPSGDNIRYAIDWDNNGSVDGYLPVSVTTAEGTILTWVNQWGGSGLKTFKVRAETSGGLASPWASHSITMYAAPSVVWTPSSNTIPYGGRTDISYTASDATYCDIFATIPADENVWEAIPYISGGAISNSWVNAGPYYRNLKRKAICYNPFGESSSYIFSLTVLQNSATCGAINSPQYLVPGESFTPSLTMNNLGTNIWTNGSPLKHSLYTTDTYWGTQHLNLSNGPIDTSGIGNFTGSLTAPLVVGNYNFVWSAMEETEDTLNPNIFGPPCSAVTPNSNQIVVKPPTLGIGTGDIDLDTITFPSDYVAGDPAITKTLTIRNRGGGTVNGSASVPAGKFTCVGGCPFSIGPGGSQDITISFQSNATGTFASILTVTSGSDIKTVALNCSTGDKFTIISSPLNFGEVATSRSKYLNITIKNNSIAQSGGTFSVAPTAPFSCASNCGSITLGAGSSTVFKLKYSPIGVDATPIYQDVIIPSTPSITLRLTGQGVKPSFKVEEL